MKLLYSLTILILSIAVVALLALYIRPRPECDTLQPVFLGEKTCVLRVNESARFVRSDGTVVYVYRLKKPLDEVVAR
jgi:hypothetical protein